MSPSPSAPPDENRPEAPGLERLVLLDVRSSGEYAAGHVRGPS